MRLEEDENQWGISYKTRQIVEPWRLGILGSCLVGINADWWTRAKNNPTKTCTGIALLSTAVAIAILGKSHLSKKLPWVVAGAILA